MDALDHIIIDVEYAGHEADIRGMLLLLIRRNAPQYPGEQIVFRRVGKKSPAHRVAWEVHKRKRKPDHVVTVREFLDLL